MNWCAKFFWLSSQGIKGHTVFFITWESASSFSHIYTFLCELNTLEEHHAG